MNAKARKRARHGIRAIKLARFLVASAGRFYYQRKQAMKYLRQLGAAAFSALLLAGCAAPVRERVIVKEAPSRVVVRQMPAPIREVPPPAPGSGYAWVPGHWVWRATSWEWQAGQWHPGHVRPMPPLIVEQITVAPSPAHFWVPGHWQWHGNDWVWVRGHWAL